MKKVYLSSSELLDYLYDCNKEKAFLELCEKELKIKLKFDEKLCVYEVTPNA